MFAGRRDGLHDLGAGGAGAEDRGDAGVVEGRDVGVGDDAAHDDRGTRPASRSAATTRGAMVRCAPLCIEMPTTSTSSSRAVAATVSGV